MDKKIKPRRMFAPTQDGFIWAELARYTAREAREAWCEGTARSWADWRKELPRLRIVRVVVTPEAP